MTRTVRTTILVLLGSALYAATAYAHNLRETGVEIAVAESQLMVTPARDWNRLNVKIGKNTETWTLDGEQLNDVTFYAGIEPGKPIMKERDKKKDPLPKFTETTLLIEIPELLERTYRTYKGLSDFKLRSSEPIKFLGQEGVSFSYEFTDGNNLIRKGEAQASIVTGKLYMITFDAPRLNYYDRTIADFRALLASARLSPR